MHSDGIRSHLAIVVEVGPTFTKALFFTSNPNWGSGARRAKLEELAHAQYVQTRKTYLSAVVRYTYEFEPAEGRVPEDAVARYLREFDFSAQEAAHRGLAFG